MGISGTSSSSQIPDGFQEISKTEITRSNLKHNIEEKLNEKGFLSLAKRIFNPKRTVALRTLQESLENNTSLDNNKLKSLPKSTQKLFGEYLEQEEISTKINSTNIKEDWQKDLIETRMNKGVDVWAEAVAEKLKNDISTFDKIFSRKEGVFNIDKLSPKELKTLSDALDKTSLKVKVSSELREMNIFSNSHLLNDYIYNIKGKISSEEAKVLSEASSLLFELKSLRNFLLLKNPDIDYSINNLKYTMSADIEQACKYSKSLNPEKAKEFLEKNYNDVKNALSKGLEMKALNEEEYKDLLNSVEKQIEQAKSQKNL